MKITKYQKLILLFLLVVFIFIYSSNTLLFEIPYKISMKIVEKTSINLWPRYYDNLEPLLKIIDDFNIFFLKKDLLDDTFPVYNLQLSANDFEHFDLVSKKSMEQGYLSEELNNWRSAELKLNGKVHKIKVKLRGDSSNHWNSRLKSYKIKTEQSDYVNNMRNINLIILEDRLLYPKIGRILAKEFNLFDIRDDIIVLKINSIVQGLYYLQENQDQIFLENNECSNCVMISRSNNYLEDHLSTSDGVENNGINFGVGHYTAFNYEVSNLNILKTENFQNKIHNPIDQLYSAIKNIEHWRVEEFFDLDQLSSYEAWRMVLGTSVVAIGDNFKMAYSQTDRKFYPIPRNEFFHKLDLHKGGFEWDLSLQTGINPVYDNYLVELLQFWNRNDQLRQMKYQKAYDLVTNSTFIDKVKKLNYIKPYFQSYRTNELNRRFIDWKFDLFSKAFEHNFAMIKKNMEYSKSYIHARLKDNTVTLEVIPDSIAAQKFDKLSLLLNQKYNGIVILETENYGEVIKKVLSFNKDSREINLAPLLNEVTFSSTLDDQMNPKIKRNIIKITFPQINSLNLENISVEIRNDITQQKLLQEDIYLRVIDQNDLYKSGQGLEQLNFSSNLNLIKGDYVITENIILPAGHTFTIPAGTSIKIAPNVSIISYSPVDIQGTAQEPVIIKGTSTKPFGTFGIIGTGIEKSTINYLDLSYGSEKWINGIYFSGALSIHHMDVEIMNSKIKNNFADDGLNIKYGNILIKDSIFQSNFADQVDLDFCNGVVKNSRFGVAKGDNNGDGLDFSGSKVLVHGNRFYSFEDKGVSIGEKTDIILYNNQIIANNNGIAVKDLSNAYLIKNIFDANNIAINSYQKKPLFGGGFTYLYENQFTNNENIYINDKKSARYDLDLNNRQLNKINKLFITEDIVNLFSTLEETKT